MYTVSIYMFKDGLNPVILTYQTEVVAIRNAASFFVATEVEYVEVFNNDELVYSRKKH